MARKGFYHLSEIQSKPPISRVAKCGACGLYKKCNSPKMEPTGKGRRKILVIAEAPGEEEDERGIQLVGNSGKWLMSCMAKHGIDMRKDCWLTNALICRPPGNKIPKPEMIEWCQPNLRNTLEELQPEIIIPLGGTAVKSLISMAWKDHDIGGITRWYGWQIPCQKFNAWICPTFHPSFLLRSKNDVLGLMFNKHIKAASEIEGPPWPDGLPDFESQVEVIHDVDKAARIIDKWVERGGECAFDFEANMLKPDGDRFQIVCCSVCYEGQRTIAFPWYGAVVPAMKRFIRARSIFKIASNMKYEERACRKVFGVGVRNWRWCTMTAAHWRDNRKGITGLKFQTFVELGVEEYNETVEPYLKAKHSNAENQIREIELGKLMLYCGLDSLYEFIISKRQRGEVGYGIASVKVD